MQTQFEDHGALLCSMMPCCNFSSIIFSISSFCTGDVLSGLALKLGISEVSIVQVVVCLITLSGSNNPSLLMTLFHFKLHSINLLTSHLVLHFLGMLRSMPISPTAFSLRSHSLFASPSGIGHASPPQHLQVVASACANSTFSPSCPGVISLTYPSAISRLLNSLIAKSLSALHARASCSRCLSASISSLEGSIPGAANTSYSCLG